MRFMAWSVGLRGGHKKRALCARFFG